MGGVLGLFLSAFSGCRQAFEQSCVFGGMVMTLAVVVVECE